MGGTAPDIKETGSGGPRRLKDLFRPVMAADQAGGPEQDPAQDNAAPGLKSGFASVATPETDNNPITDNAFAQNASRQTMEKLALAALAEAQDGMAGPVGPSLARVSALAGKFMGAVTGKKDEKKDRGIDMLYISMMQKMIDDMNQRIAEIDRQLEEIDEKLETIADIRDLIDRGDFDPLKNENHLALLQKIDPAMTLETWNALTPMEQQDWLDDNQDKLNQEAQRLNLEKEESLEVIRTAEHEGYQPSNENGKFDNSIWESAAQSYETRTGQHVDRENLDQDTRVALYGEIYILRSQQILQNQALQDTGVVPSNDEVASLGEYKNSGFS